MYQVHPDIALAQTLPSSFYFDTLAYERLLQGTFLKTWQWLGHEALLPQSPWLHPFRLLPGSLDIPLLLSKDEQGQIHCLSNVCTHRGAILVQEPCTKPRINCPYHGRCFDLKGQFRSMPEFKQTLNFPTEQDHLPALSVQHLGPFLFGSLNPQTPFEEVFAPIIQRLDGYPFDELQHAPQHSKTYETQAHWALYCDNYLEGFHVPFVHPGLGANLNYAEYRTELFPHASLQVGIADDHAPAFELPSHSPDYGQRVHAYYWWIFPNLMLNVYTWGISVNIVQPLGLNRSRIVFETFLLPDQDPEDFSTELLHLTEMEDEAVVESVQQGLRSPLYQHGRFSVRREQGVHHFHRLLAQALQA
jgi:choline monooxygenase